MYEKKFDRKAHKHVQNLYVLIYSCSNDRKQWDTVTAMWLVFIERSMLENRFQPPFKSASHSI